MIRWEIFSELYLCKMHDIRVSDRSKRVDIFNKGFKYLYEMIIEVNFLNVLCDEMSLDEFLELLRTFLSYLSGYVD